MRALARDDDRGRLEELKTLPADVPLLLYPSAPFAEDVLAFLRDDERKRLIWIYDRDLVDEQFIGRGEQGASQ